MDRLLSFSDKDLEDIKKILSLKDTIVITLHVGTMRGLVARLETAEEFIEAKDRAPEVKDKHLEAWRKAAGK